MKHRSRAVLSIVLFVLSAAVAVAFALALYYGLENQNVIDELTVRRQLSVAAGAVRDGVQRELRLIERSWAGQFRASQAEASASPARPAPGGAPSSKAGRAVEALRADLQEPGLVAEWLAYRRGSGDSLSVWAFDGAEFRRAETPAWLSAALRPAGGPYGPPSGSSVPFGPRNPVLLPTPPEPGDYAIALRVDLEALRERLIPSLADRFFLLGGDEETVAVEVFEYSGSFPAETVESDLLFPLSFAPDYEQGEGPRFSFAWRTGDWGLSVRYGPKGVRAAVAATTRRNAAVCAGLLVVLLTGIALSFAAERRSLLSAERERDFVALFSHELKTPLAVTRSNAENLAAGLARTDEEVRAQAAVIVAANKRLSALVETILQAAAGGKRKSEKLDLGALVEAAADRVRPLAVQWDATIDFVPPKKPCWVVGDEGALAGAFDALIVNAVVHGRPPQGEHRIKIQVFSNQERSWLLFGKLRDVSYAMVSDRGRGVPRREVLRARSGRIGKTRAASGRESTLPSSGIGLPIALKTVRAHGGCVHFQRWPAACVLVSFPYRGT